MRQILVVLLLTLAGCADPGEPDAIPTPVGQVHVLVVGGTVTETGPEPEARSMCDMAAPPWSADDDQKKVWWVDVEWMDGWDPAGANILIIRVDRTELVADDGCWIYQLEAYAADEAEIVWERYDAARATMPVVSQGDHITVGDARLDRGDETTWTIDRSCYCDPYYDAWGAYRYRGTLDIMYLGLWSSNDVIEVASYGKLPPLDVPYWDGY